MTDLFGADLVTRLLSLPLTAIRAVAVIPPEPIAHMPACTVGVPVARLLVASISDLTPIPVETLEQISRDQANDVLLIRAGPHPETFNAVTVDIALRFGGDALVVTDLLFFRHLDRGLWLVPTTRGPFIELTRAGLRLEMLPPWLDADERSAGLCRAAAEIARLARRRPVPRG